MTTPQGWTPWKTVGERSVILCAAAFAAIHCRYLDEAEPARQVIDDMCRIVTAEGVTDEERAEAANTLAEALRLFERCHLSTEVEA